MKLNNMVPFRAPVLGLALLAALANGLGQEYCSPENTGSDYDAVYNIYQSNGACFNQCKGTYAFAVVQYENCWCSNYIPADQQDVHACDQKCPGYPYELCGNKDRGLYGYIKLSSSPSGTAGTTSSTKVSSAPPSTMEQHSSAQQPSSTPQEKASTSEAQVSYVAVQTVTQTASQSPSTVVSYVTPTPSSTSRADPTTSSSTPESTTTSSSSTTPAPAPTPATTEESSSPVPPSATPSPIISLRVVTVSGAVVTQTVTSTPMVAPDANADTAPLHRNHLSGGAIAGTVVGTLVGLAALLAGAWFLWRRRRDRDPEKSGSFHHRNSPRRQISVLSKTGLLNRGRPASITEKDFDEPLYVNTHTGNNSVRHSLVFGAGGLGGEGVSPVSPLASSHDTASSRRHSRPLVYDQRLNPSALFANTDANGSRVSIQDQRDYSRPLGVMNPDPRPSFESRNTDRRA